MTRLQLWLVQALGILIAAGLAYAWADSRGYARCKAEQAAAVASANVDLVAGERERDRDADKIADKARNDGAAAAAEAKSEVQDAGERIKVVYRDRWVDAPAGSCAMPLDPRVQAEIDAAVRRSNLEK